MDLENFLERVLDAMTTISAVPSKRQLDLEGRVTELQSDCVGDLGALETRVEYLEERNEFHLAAAKKNAKKQADLDALAVRLGEVQSENKRLGVMYIRMAEKYASLTGRSHYSPDKLQQSGCDGVPIPKSKTPFTIVSLDPDTVVPALEYPKEESLGIKNQGIQELSAHIDKFFWQKLQGIEEKNALITLVCEAAADYARHYPDYRKGERIPYGDPFDQWTIREVSLLYIKSVLAARVVENCAGSKERNYEAHATYSIRENGKFWRGDKGRRLSYSTRDRAQTKLEECNGHN